MTYFEIQVFGFAQKLAISNLLISRNQYLYVCEQVNTGNQFSYAKCIAETAAKSAESTLADSTPCATALSLQALNSKRKVSSHYFARMKAADILELRYFVRLGSSGSCKSYQSCAQRSCNLRARSRKLRHIQRTVPGFFARISGAQTIVNAVPKPKRNGKAGLK